MICFNPSCTMHCCCKEEVVTQTKTHNSTTNNLVVDNDHIHAALFGAGESGKSTFYTVACNLNKDNHIEKNISRSRVLGTFFNELFNHTFILSLSDENYRRSDELNIDDIKTKLDQMIDTQSNSLGIELMNKYID